MPLRSIADAELNAEINTETNEEDTEGDRDRVESSDHPKPDSGCENQPDHEIDERQPKMMRAFFSASHSTEPTRSKRHRAVQGCAFNDGGKFLVREDHRPRKAHLHAFVGGEPKPGRRFTYECRCLASRLQIAEVQNRLDVHKATKLRGLRRPPGDQRAPRERDGSSRSPGLPAHLRSQRAPDLDPSSLAFPRRTPSSDCDSVRKTPRSVGSAANVPRKGCARSSRTCRGAPRPDCGSGFLPLEIRCQRRWLIVRITSDRGESSFTSASSGTSGGLRCRRFDYA